MVSLQVRTLRLYAELLARSSAWAGKLVLTAGAGSSGTGLLAAACIAGACALAVDPDARAARACLRDGGVDFVVNTLDEALRVLKNEVRRGRALGVVLTADVDQVRAEMVERGVLADLGVNAAGFPAKASVDVSEAPSEAAQSWLAEHGWGERAVEGSPEFAVDDPRSAWVRGIVRYQRSAAREPRVVWASVAR